LGIPARFCSSYSWGLRPADFHAHFEAWLGGRWLVYDATRLSPETGFVRIGVGRDAADTAVATVTGPVTFRSLDIDVRLLSPEAEFPGYAADPLCQSDEKATLGPN
jgi:transglutaminase-like putative cysteine protease